MATQWWLVTNASANHGIHRGDNTPNLAGATPGWTTNCLRPVRGQSLNGYGIPTVAGPTVGLEIYSAGAHVEWISFALDRDVTISGPISCNLWGRMATDVNAAINCYIDRIDSQGNLSRIGQSTNTTKLFVSGTTATANAFSITPTSTNMLKGDRIRLVVYYDDSASATMAVGTANLTYSSSTADIDGDSYVTFTETFGAQLTEPTGTVLYPTDTTAINLPPITGVVQSKLSFTRGSASVGLAYTTIAGWTPPLQWKNGATSVQEWFSQQVTGFTLDGLVRVQARLAESSASANCGFRAELAICNFDGSGVVVWGASNFIDTSGNLGTNYQSYPTGELMTPTETQFKGWLAGPTTVVPNGKRLRFRLYLDDISDTPMVSGYTATMWFNGPTVSASGDAWIQLPQTITEYTPAGYWWWGTISTNWSSNGWRGWVATAATRRTSAPSATASVTTLPLAPEWAATVASNWGTWTATAIGQVPFNAPLNVVATATGKTTITLTWSAAPSATSYDIERDSVVIATGHAASPYLDTGLTSNTLYSYRVRGRRAA